MLRAEKNTEFKWHIEPRKLPLSIKLHARKIMYTVAALLYNVNDCSQAELHSVVDFFGATWNKTRVENHEYTCMKHVRILTVERAVYKHVIVVFATSHISQKAGAIARLFPFL